jgi:Short C-terminal domain
MFRRRPLMRAAVVGGGAYMAGKAHARNQAEQAQYQADQDARIGNLEQQQAGQQPAGQQQDYQQPAGQPQGSQQPAQPQYQQPPPPPPAAPAASSSMIDQLNQLAALHQQGVLTDDEFAAAKAKLFGS